jgi:hypothetical protein
VFPSRVLASRDRSRDCGDEQEGVGQCRDDLGSFSPYLGWVPVTAALGAFAGRIATSLYAVGITGVPGLPFLSSLCLVVVGLWPAVGRSPIVREEPL